MSEAGTARNGAAVLGDSAARPPGFGGVATSSMSSHVRVEKMYTRSKVTAAMTAGDASTASTRVGARSVATSENGWGPVESRTDTERQLKAGRSAPPTIASNEGCDGSGTHTATLPLQGAAKSRSKGRVAKTPKPCTVAEYSRRPSLEGVTRATMLENEHRERERERERERTKEGWRAA